MIVTLSVKGKSGTIPKVQMSIRNITYYIFRIWWQQPETGKDNCPFLRMPTENTVH